MIFPETRIAPGDVHGWTVDLDALSADDLAERFDIFSADERQRAARFTFPLHRDRYLACRLALRHLLSHQLDVDPGNVRIRIEAIGKPAIDEAWHASNLTFNLAHCEGTAIIVLARGTRLGVDLEDETREIEIEEVGETVFSKAECLQLGKVPRSHRTTLFFQCWTAREAYLKCIGSGLAVDPEEFVVLGGDGILSHVCGRDGAIRNRFAILLLRQKFPMIAALVVEGSVKEMFIREISWTPILRGRAAPTPEAR